jgi:hypothetical protein
VDEFLGTELKVKCKNQAYETAADMPAPTAPKSERVAYLRKEDDQADETA